MKIWEQVEINGVIFPHERDATPEEETAMRPKGDEPTPDPSDFDRIEAQALYTALMTDTLLEV